MTSAWLHAEGVTVLEKVPGPITMPRGFRRRERRRLRRREPRAIVRDVTVRTEGGLSVVAGTPAVTAALAGTLAGVVAPDAGVVASSHRPVAVLRARGRLVVDLRVRSAILRELRLRGISTSRGKEIVDEVCRMVGVDPRGWASDLDKQVLLRVAPAAAVCSDAPILILDGVFSGQSSEFDDALLERLAARSRRFDLVTILCAPERRGIDELIEVLDVQEVLSLPREPNDDRGQPSVDVADQENDYDEEDDDDERERIDMIEVVEATAPARDLVTFDHVGFAQFGDEVDTIDGRAPFTIRIAFTSSLEGPTQWSLRLVHRAEHIVLAAASGTTEAGTTVSAAILDVPGGICSGKLALHARVEGLAGGRRYVVVQPTVSLVPIVTTGDNPSEAVAAGTLTFAP